MNLHGLSLPEWLEKQEPKNFPTGFDYPNGYKALATHLTQHVHKQVTPGNIHADGGYLTDHGPDHIQKLIERLGALLSVGPGDITPYETYFLLTAAQFHDVGNIFGREKHEEKSREVMNDVGAFLPMDSLERRHIHQIAQAHGGQEKDKISRLPLETDVRGKKIRMQLLAAILKFADELAEDKERAARYPFDKGMLPSESEIYHAYALSLDSVMVDAREVRMTFDMPRERAVRTFLKKGRPDTQVYLVDEIFARTVKTHYERVYCSRFMRSVVDVNRVSVNIVISDDRGYQELKKVAFRLEEVGYPDSRNGDIYKLCPELRAWEGNGELNGKMLAKELGGVDA